MCKNQVTSGYRYVKIHRFVSFFLGGGIFQNCDLTHTPIKPFHTVNQKYQQELQNTFQDKFK